MSKVKKNNTIKKLIDKYCLHNNLCINLSYQTPLKQLAQDRQHNILTFLVLTTVNLYTSVYPSLLVGEFYAYSIYEIGSVTIKDDEYWWKQNANELQGFLSWCQNLWVLVPWVSFWLYSTIRQKAWVTITLCMYIHINLTTLSIKIIKAKNFDALS